MKAAVIFIVLIGVLAVPGTASATPSGAMPISATLVGNGCGSGYPDLPCGSGGGGSCLCLYGFWTFAGDALLAPPLGRAPFLGDYSDGYICPDPNFPYCLTPYNAYSRSLKLTFSAANGDELVLSENETVYSTTPLPLLILGSNPVQGEWSVDHQDSTGRFASYTGGGTYTLTYDVHYDSATFTFDLSGLLTPHGANPF